MSFSSNPFDLETLQSLVFDVSQLLLEDADQRLVIGDELEVRASQKEVSTFVDNPNSCQTLLLDGSVIAFG